MGWADGRGTGGAGGGARLSRRGLLRAGVALALAGPALAACTGEPAQAAPDALLPLLDATTAEAAAAKAAAAAFPADGPTLTVISTVCQEQAAALRREVDRAAVTTPASSSAAPTSAPTLPDQHTVTTALLADLTTVQKKATALVPTVPRYRAGLVGSVAAGCASLTEALTSTPITGVTVSSPGSTSAANPASTPASAAAGSTGSAAPGSTPPPSDTADALQSALAAEHAALWMYGLASAYVTGQAGTEVIAAMAVVQNLRDATARRLTAGGAAPQPAKPAYVVPKPVTDQVSALGVLALAEADATVAWRGVLERTDDAAVRTAAGSALVDSAVRQTRWRRLAGETPSSVALPGQAG